MRQLHNKPSHQQQWSNALSMHNNIGMFKNAGDKCVLFTRSNEYTYKRPENIQVQEQ
jgi:hypothetical protein